MNLSDMPSADPQQHDIEGKRTDTDSASSGSSSKAAKQLCGLEGRAVFVWDRRV